MNLMFEWKEQYITNERSERVRYFSCNTAFLMIFRRVSKIFHNCSAGQTNAPEHFQRISENFRRCPKTSKEDPEMFR